MASSQVSDPIPAITTNVQPKKISTKNHHYCSVSGCKSSVLKDSRTSFHTFPKEGDSRILICDAGFDEVLDRRDAWGRRTFIGKKYGKDITPGLYVCSRHFTPSDYCSQDGSRKLRRLRKTAVPSMNLPSRPASPTPPNPEKLKIRDLKFRKKSDTPAPETTTTTLPATDKQLPSLLSTNVSQVKVTVQQNCEGSGSKAQPSSITSEGCFSVVQSSGGAKTLLEMFEEGGESLENQISWGLDSPAGTSKKSSDSKLGTTLVEVLQSSSAAEAERKNKDVPL